MFVDTAEWQDTSYAFIKDEMMIFTNNFEFTKTQMHLDSLFLESILIVMTITAGIRLRQELMTLMAMVT